MIQPHQDPLSWVKPHFIWFAIITRNVCHSMTDTHNASKSNSSMFGPRTCPTSPLDFRCYAFFWAFGLWVFRLPFAGCEPPFIEFPRQLIPGWLTACTQVLHLHLRPVEATVTPPTTLCHPEQAAWFHNTLHGESYYIITHQSRDNNSVQILNYHVN